MKIFIKLAIVGIIIVGLLSCEKSNPTDLSNDTENWVEETLESMSIEEKSGTGPLPCHIPSK